MGAFRSEGMLPPGLGQVMETDLILHPSDPHPSACTFRPLPEEEEQSP